MTQTTYILHGAPGPIAPAALPADPDHVRWDGADPATTHTIRLANASEIMGREIRAYIQIEITGRAPRPQRIRPCTGGPSYVVHGMRARARFTGTDDTGAWFPVVLVEPAPNARLD